MSIYNEKQYMSNSLITSREKVENRYIVETRNELDKALDKALAKKGGGSFTSAHEIYGALSEEMKEVLDEIHHGDLDACAHELLDIAVVALWGATCINQKIKKYE